MQYLFSIFIKDKRSSLNDHLEASGEEHLRNVWSKYLETTERSNQYETEMQSMKERIDGNEEEINELLIEKVSTKEMLSHLEGENCGQRKELQTNTESMTKRLNELEKESKSYNEWQNETRVVVERLNEELEIGKAQLAKLETEKESMKKFQDQKVEEVVNECRSSQKKFEEQNIALKKEVAKLKMQLQDAKSTAANDAQKLKRDMQALYSEVQAMRGKRTSCCEDLPDRSSLFIERETSIVDKTRHPLERTFLDRNVKKPRIDKQATKCRYVLAKTEGY